MRGKKKEMNYWLFWQTKEQSEEEKDTEKHSGGKKIKRVWKE